MHYTNCAHKINGELLLWQKNGEYNCKLDVSYKIPTKTKRNRKITAFVIVAGLLTANK